MKYGFKVFDRTTRKFLSKGGRWSKNGKVWSRFQDVKLALSGYEIELGWEIIVFERIKNTALCVKTSLSLKEDEIVKLAYSQSSLAKDENKEE